MKRMFTLLALVWAGLSMGADWQVTQSDSISAYVMCHQGDCPVRTAKVLDLPVSVARRCDLAGCGLFFILRTLWL